MRPVACALSALLLICVLGKGAAANQPCTLPRGLYARRQALEKQYLERVGNNYLLHKSDADRVKMRLKQIDHHYQLLLSRLCKAAHDGNRDEVASCCTKLGDDPPAAEVCNLSRYLASDRGDSASFVAAFPETPEEVTVLWNLEEMTYGSQGSMVTDCGPSSLVDLYVDELFHLAVLGNRRALLKFVNLSHHAEGVFAEGLADRMKRLIVEKPQLVLKEWSVIRGFSYIEGIGAEFVDSERATAERNSDNLCKRPSKACIEIRRAIGSCKN